jgi:hypothetical protein
MFYSVLLTMVADATLFEHGVRQFVARIPFEGVAQCEAEISTLMKFAAAKLQICAN